MGDELTMRALAASLLLLLALAAPVSARPYAIAVPDTGLGEVEVTWSAGQYRGSLWSRMDCSDGRSIVLTGYERLDDSAADFHTVGDTPSWDGTSSLTCTVRLFVFDGDFGRARATDTFEVTP